MTLLKALNASNKEGFNYFRYGYPRTDLEHLLFEAISNRGTPTTIVYRSNNYIVFSIDNYYIYTVYGFHDRTIADVFKKFMSIFNKYEDMQ
jgi:hypothetical protein